jgi:hypothetical protein
MGRWLKELDRILRGDATRPPALVRGTIEVPAGGLSAVGVVLAMIYGVCMGVFALLRPAGPVYIQTVATTLKVPALFFFTLLVTFPSLYVFNALVGSRLSVVSLLRLVVAAMAVTLAVLASFGPIVAFFSVCTTSYPFMILLNVAIYSVAGVLGLKFLLMTLGRLSAFWVEGGPASQNASAGNPGGDEAPAGGLTLPVARPVTSEPGPLERPPGHVFARHVKTVFRSWVVIFGLVGAQMGWVLRPFVGNPDQRFQWFRVRESSFFEGVWSALLRLFS